MLFVLTTKGCFISLKAGNFALNNVPSVYMNRDGALVSKGSDVDPLDPTYTDLRDCVSNGYDKITDKLELSKSHDYIKVVPTSILDNNIVLLSLHVLGAGLIAVSAIGLWYTKPEYKKTRLGLQALFIAGLASIVFAAFKANLSINLPQKL